MLSSRSRRLVLHCQQWCRHSKHSTQVVVLRPCKDCKLQGSEGSRPDLSLVFVLQKLQTGRPISANSRQRLVTRFSSITCALAAASIDIKSYGMQQTLVASAPAWRCCDTLINLHRCAVSRQSTLVRAVVDCHCPTFSSPATVHGTAEFRLSFYKTGRCMHTVSSIGAVCKLTLSRIKRVDHHPAQR